MTRFSLVFLTLALCLTPSCQTASVAARAAQGAMEPYAFHIRGDASGDVFFNSRFLAVDAEVTATIELLHNGAVVWSRTFNKSAGQRAYELVIGDDGPTVVKSTWVRAMQSFQHQVHSVN